MAVAGGKKQAPGIDRCERLGQTFRKCRCLATWMLTLVPLRPSGMPGPTAGRRRRASHDSSARTSLDSLPRARPGNVRKPNFNYQRNCRRNALPSASWRAFRVRVTVSQHDAPLDDAGRVREQPPEEHEQQHAQRSGPRDEHDVQALQSLFSADGRERASITSA